MRLDMPGFGGTPAESAAGVTVPARAAFVLDALDALAIDRCVLVGHSMGGPVAAAAAAGAAGRVVGLGLLASVGLSPHRLLRRALLRGPMGRAVDRPLVGPLARGAALRLLRLAGFPSSTRPDEAAQTMRVLGAFHFAPMREAVAALRAPTLTAFAEDDPFIEPAIAEALSGAVPAGPRLRWATGGHNIQKSHSAELAAALLPML